MSESSSETTGFVVDEVDLMRRFIDKVDIPERDNLDTECWMWTGCNNRDYGYISVDGDLKQAHRVSYYLFNGYCAGDKDIMHKCRNKLCVNPEHLKRGTRSENMIHAVKAGKIAKLDPQRVKNIKHDLKHTNLTHKEISKRYSSVTKHQVDDISRGKTWNHVTLD